MEVVANDSKCIAMTNLFLNPVKDQKTGKRIISRCVKDINWICLSMTEGNKFTMTIGATNDSRLVLPFGL